MFTLPRYQNVSLPPFWRFFGHIVSIERMGKMQRLGCLVFLLVICVSVTGCATTGTQGVTFMRTGQGAYAKNIIDYFIKAYTNEDIGYASYVLNNRVILDGQYYNKAEILRMLDREFAYWDFEDIHYDYIDTKHESRFAITTMWIEYRQIRYDDLKPRDLQSYIWEFIINYDTGLITSWTRKPDTRRPGSDFVLDGDTLHP
jgi:hypothetical protein